MVQVVKKTKVDGVIHETEMAFSDNEWKLLQEHYPISDLNINKVGFELVDGSQVENNDVPKSDAPIDGAGRDKDDDKPKMRDYTVVKDRAMDYFREENWDKALYYFQVAHKLKGHAWLVGKMTLCKKNAEADLAARPNS